VYDEYVEELSSPGIFSGQPRKFNPDITVKVVVKIDEALLRQNVFCMQASEMFETLREKKFGTVPMILSGDFHLDSKKKENNEFVDFMKDKLRLQLNTRY